MIFFFFSSLQRASTPFLTLFLSLNRTPPTTNSSKTHHSKVSFGKVLTPFGVALLTYGFGAFFGLLPGADVSPIMLVYGFPVSLLGFALFYAQLEPVPCKSTAAAAAAREAGAATDIQKQLRDDVTRYRYGDEQHLEEALARIFQFGRPNGIQRRLAPRLVGLREEMAKASPEASAAAYTLILEFDTKPEMTLEMWTDRKDKIEGFFGPGIIAGVAEAKGRIPELAGGKAVDVALTVDGSGAGKGGPEQKDVLPPLVPGAPARRQ
mgnify:CR=1 FL=1